MLTPPVYCPFPDPQYLLFSDNVPPLVYYSHFAVFCAALLVALFVLFINRKELANKILFLTLTAFVLWVGLDSIFWAANNSDVIMFVWSLQILFEPLVYLGSLYLFYILLKKKSVPFWWKVFFLVPYIPIAIAVPTSLALPGFDLSACLSIEGFISIYYTYPLELFYTLVLSILAVREYHAAIDRKRKKEIFFLAFGTVFFLLSFSWGNIVSSFSENWNFAQIGLFAMPVFIGFLAYSIVRFQTFSTKLVGSVFLAAALWLFELALLFLQTNSVARMVTIITLLFTAIFGALLVRGVQREVRQRLELAELAEQLKNANLRLQELDKQKTEFLSIASHQLRTPLSVIKGYVELLQDGAYGKLTKGAMEILGNMDDSNEHLVKLVDDFLDVSRIEQGRTKYSFKKDDLATVIDSVVSELKMRAEEKGLKLIWKHVILPSVEIDSEKIRHVVFNFVDNAIKYSGKGSIIINTMEDSNGVKVSIKDRGMGFGMVDEVNFFQKFYRGDNARSSCVNGTGLGLYVCRMFVEGHHGKVWGKSLGLGKGSEFGFWIPLSGEK